MMPRLGPKQKAGLAVAFALLLWMPSGISTESLPVVTGHSVFYNGETFDRCLASIAGIMRSRVMWFNDMVLVEQYAGKGTFIYITEDGGRNPLEMRYLYSEGVFYDFVDPNGAHWHVEELYIANSLPGSGIKSDGDPLQDPQSDVPTVAAHDPEKKQYVWVVELSERPIHDEFAGDDPRYAHDLYNFLLIVDTCKMNRDRTQPGHHQDPEAWNVTHEGENLTTDRGHPTGTDVHQHEIHTVNIYSGTRPLIVPAGASAQTAQWQADWATGYAANDTTRPSTGGVSSNEYPCRPDDPTTTEDESGC